MQNDIYLATAFQDVDTGSETGKVRACLSFMNDLPSFVHYKERTLGRMQLMPGECAMDLGCGLGYDVVRLAQAVAPDGQAIGIDNSKALLQEARRCFGGEPGIRFVESDGHDLDLPANLVDAIRCDRVLQHVADPLRVILEMIRVLKPGGRLVCSEPDWGTFVIDAENQEIARMIADSWAKSFRNPWIGRQLLRLVQSAGLENVWVEGHVLHACGLEAVDRVFDVCVTLDRMGVHVPDMRPELDRWLDGLRRRDRESNLSAYVTVFLAGGHKGHSPRQTG